MRWIRFTTAGRTAYGILEGDQVAEVTGDPFAGWQTTGKRHALAAVKLEIPVVPRTFYCAGLNYVEHVIEGAKKRGEVPNIPARPEIGYRANNALIAHDETVIIPADATEKIHYEGELVAVIGKQAKNLSEAEALSCVMGWTIGNDVSERSWQRADRTFWRSKNTDTFKPMGPYIQTEFDLEAAQTNVRLNGEVRTSFATGHMLFSCATFIAAMTKYITLYPGDVIWLGTDGQSPDVKSGDVVEVEITGLGTLRNPFLRAAE
jgi:2-keto-4-pentenoate hydratase/2-oxohepta-3-ene-1,7-dioic acid hydratase in catechol pathway